MQVDYRHARSPFRFAGRLHDATGFTPVTAFWSTSLVAEDGASDGRAHSLTGRPIYEGAVPDCLRGRAIRAEGSAADRRVTRAIRTKGGPANGRVACAVRTKSSAADCRVACAIRAEHRASDLRVRR